MNDSKQGGEMEEYTARLVAAADQHADDYEGHPIPANEIRAALTNAFYAGSRWGRNALVNELCALPSPPKD